MRYFFKWIYVAWEEKWIVSEKNDRVKYTEGERCWWIKVSPTTKKPMQMRQWQWIDIWHMPSKNVDILQGEVINLAGLVWGNEKTLLCVWIDGKRHVTESARGQWREKEKKREQLISSSCCSHRIRLLQKWTVNCWWRSRLSCSLLAECEQWNGAGMIERESGWVSA